MSNLLFIIFDNLFSILIREYFLDFYRYLISISQNYDQERKTNHFILQEILLKLNRNVKIRYRIPRKLEKQNFILGLFKTFQDQKNI